MAQSLATLQAIAALLGVDVAKSFDGPILTVTADGAIPIDQDRTIVISKTSAAAMTVAAPGAANVGRQLNLLTGTDFQHVVTFTGTILADGTTGLNTTWTATAFAGCGLSVFAVTATRWNVLAFNLGVIAP